MPEENAGQETTGEDLSKQLAQKDEVIDRLRGTQSSLDRANEELRSKLGKLETQLQDLITNIKAKDQELADFASVKQQFVEQQSQLQKLGKQLEASTARAERLRVVAELAGDNPAISVLAKNGALPQADTVEEFTERLNAIAESMSGIIETQARVKLQGSKPAPQRAQDMDKDSMQAKGRALINDGRVQEGLELIQKSMTLGE